MKDVRGGESPPSLRGGGASIALKIEGPCC